MHKYKFGYIAFLLVFTFAVVVNAQTASDQAVTSVAPSEVSDTKTLPPPPFGGPFGASLGITGLLHHVLEWSFDVTDGQTGGGGEVIAFDFDVAKLLQQHPGASKRGRSREQGEHVVAS